MYVCIGHFSLKCFHLNARGKLLPRGELGDLAISSSLAAGYSV